MKSYDLIVAGGGFAGVAAAVAAARGGAKVLLFDKGNALGGAAVNCLVNPFMRYWTKINDARVDLSAGIFREIHEILVARGAMRHEEFLEEELKVVLDDLVSAADVDLLYHATLCRAERAGGKIASVTVATRSGELTLSAPYFIDATGDALLTALAGFPTVLGREPDHLCQPMTLCFRVGNVDVAAFDASRDAMQAAYRAEQAAGRLTNPREDVLVFHTPIPNVLHFNTTRVVKKDPTDPFDYTAAERIARRQAVEMFAFLKAHAAGMENAFLLSTAAEIGVRESRMIVGDYVLTETDCKALTKFPDGIAACNYDIDIHNPEGSGTSHYYFGPGEFYTIPYRCLLPVGSENLLVAGRCISSDHGAQASYRIMPVVCCLGEAAGTAAALAVADGIPPRAVNVEKLRSALRVIA